MEKYDPKKIEPKWAKRWIEEKAFVPDLSKAKNPYYALFMFPYPSAEGLHIGNFYAFTSIDVMAKYKKLRGFDIFEPVGWDAFGIHSENYALKIGETPSKMLERTIKNFSLQIQAAGLSCDWTREVNTTSPEYYKWTQWIFVKLFEKGLAYQKEALINWCSDCKTVLADEQIEADGLCERCKTVVEKRKMKQWFFKITAYAERLLLGLEDMDWSDITKSAQKNWIGKSEGAEFELSIKNNELKIKVFTTRLDTVFGMTFALIAPEHELVQKLKPQITNWPEVEKYIQQAKKKSDLQRQTEMKDKTGVELKGIEVVNPFTKKIIPLFVSDFVLAHYGTGAVMAVPGHDQRDWEFAKKFELPIKEVIKNTNKESSIEKEAYVEDGILINSGEYDELTSTEARKKLTAWLEKEGIGKRTLNYKLRDWCISRQRYWGPPIPVVYCENCGTVAIPEKDLPVKLPNLKEGWEPAGNGKGPLANVKSFMRTQCPKCGREAQREADVMDNFLDSAWYFFRYISPKDDKNIFDEKLGKKWLPIDIYIGGNEHAVLHLMYTRFVTMFLHDLGLIGFDNPFKRFRANGMILKGGEKMSKSKGNVVNPEEYGEKIGYDALKTYLLFIGPLVEDRNFSDKGIMGAVHWAERIFNLYVRVSQNYPDDEKLVRKLHKTIKAVAENMENQKYNTSIAKLMEMTNVLYEYEKISAENWKKFLIMTAIFLPALSEELWSQAGNKESIFKQKWPEYDKKLIQDEEFELIVQINGKVRDRIKVKNDTTEDRAKDLAIKSQKIKNYLSGKEIRKVIFVKNRLINIATS